MDRRLGIAGAVALIVVVAASLLASGERESTGPSLRRAALSAEDFLDSVGVVVHFNYVDTPYMRQPELIQKLRELGVHHVRDAMPARVEPLATGLRAAGDAGIRATLGTGDVQRDPAAAVADSLSVMGDDIEAFEGPNELDNRGDPAWAATLRAYMPALAAAVQRQAPGVPVIGPSFVNAGSRGYLPTDLPGLVNGHPYPGGEPPEPTLGAELARLREPADARPVVFTETGYHNALNAAVGQPPASEEAVATYLPRLLLTAFGAGVRRTFIYELVDVQDEPGLADPEAHFGLLRSDLSPKPAFTAIQRLIKALRSAPAKSSGRALSWRLRGAEEGQVQRLMLRRQDGSHALALWRPVSVWDRDARQPIQPDPLRVELILERGTRDMVVWRPSVAEGPVLRRAAAERLALDLEGDVVLVGLR